ncbi:hypothetical protein [Streptomyces sp. NPDC057854]|uniref:hypothetical protein n=1 Tax=unclassified Streptomyces TaxID=2593676 RepID=UPI0036822D82
MNNTKRALAAIALAGAALSFTSTAHADSIGAGDSGGLVLDQSHNFALDAQGDSIFSGQNNEFGAVTNEIQDAAKNIVF